ncbi:hypothetical protein LCGC14_0163480 [marine sediment metagenome]|uniref:Uncharacterized protein n=1 Tax=marine sediment metagenome TaxID=412755 RepID=A0A0F9UYA1_9ZZZZ
MSEIQINAARVLLTETTLRELVAACEQARAEIPFTDDPMPDGDMEMTTYDRERSLRGLIRVQSHGASAVIFKIALDGTQSGGGESVGYRLVQPFADDLETATRMHGLTSKPRSFLIVHILYHGKALCGMEGVPREWHKDHHWTQYPQVSTCYHCRHQEALDVGL